MNLPSTEAAIVSEGGRIREGDKERVPRLILAWEALLRGCPRIEVEDSLTAFMRRIQQAGPNGREIRRFKDQRIAALYNQAVEGFLRRTFHSLTFIPQISFDTTNISESVERKVLNTALVHYRAAEMERQARLLKNAYDGLRALRIVLGPIWHKSLVETVVPSRFLPELLVSAPVWFIEKKKGVGEK